ncbi:MAG: gliding motility-associated C-terminal domain-containing protein, partial [Capnocytophaga sp.]|nr:gliding motility-associated C-terminal domain-containing protein [Capnocytophaga sp.]
STTASILANDTLNNVNVSTPTVVGTLPTGLTLNPDGTVTIADDVPTGTYTFTYEICEVGAVPANCVTATVTIDVTGTTSPTTNTIIANDDVFTNPLSPSGGTAGNVLTNDTYNGVAVNPSEVTITITDPQATGVYIDADGNLIVPANVRAGNYTVTYTVCHNVTNVCDTATVTFAVSGCELQFYNAISVNGDGLNDGFIIGGIECYPDNNLMIFNRWGVKVYEKSGYNNVDNLFRGISQGRTTVEASKKLPQGTYYYILEYADQNGNRHNRSGWLYVKQQ